MWTLILLGVASIAGIDLWIAGERFPSTLELDIARSSAASQLQVYFDTGQGYRESASAAKPVAAGAAVQRLLFPLPKQPVRAFRFDPLMTEGTVVIRDAKIVTDRSGRSDVPLDLHGVTPLHEIAQLSFPPEACGGLEIVTAPGSTDSQCLLTPAHPVTGHQRGRRELFLTMLPIDVSLFFIGLLAAGVFWMATGQSPAAWWRARRAAATPAAPGRTHPLIVLGTALLGTYAWLLTLNMGRSPLVPFQEPSWVAVLTYAIAQRWQYGRDIIMTYGPAMPLTICSYIGSIDTAVVVGRLLTKAWSVVLLVWLGRRLPPGRRWIFWVVSVPLFGAFSEPAFFEMTILAAGLLFARGSRASRRLLVPTMLCVALIAMVKVTFLMYAVLMLGAVAADRAWRRQWLAAVIPGVCFLFCFAVEWCLLGQNLTSLPLYLRGSFEMVGGYSQAMSLPPEPAVLTVGVIMAAAAVAQLIFFFLPDRRPRWAALPFLGLLSGGLLMSWKQGFVRADYHVVDWLVYAVAAAAAAPAFFPGEKSRVKRWADGVCLVVILFAGANGLARIDPEAGTHVAAMLRSRWRGDLIGLFHLREAAQAAKRDVVTNRQTYALPRTCALVGQSRVDVFCDEQAIAILNGLNYRPRPSFLGYSTYTPWLVALDVDFYASAERAPEFVLFKLESIDNRLPTLQNAPLLLVLAQCYEPVLTEGGFTLLRRRVLPAGSAETAAAVAATGRFELVKEGDFALAESLPLPPASSAAGTPDGGALWCELELRETLLGKLLKTVYQQPALGLSVTSQAGAVSEYRLIPKLASGGFLIDPLPRNGDEFLRWQAGQPLETIRSVQVANVAAVSRIFLPVAHYKFYRVPLPYAPPK